MDFNSAPEIKIKIKDIIEKLKLTHIRPGNLFCYRSQGSKSRAIARIWSLPRVWQMALNHEPGYVIEVITEKFDRLRTEEQERVLIHELLHIPKTFSGALVPHLCFGKRIDRRAVEKYYTQYKNAVLEP